MRFGDEGVSFSGKADTHAAKFGGRFIGRGDSEV